MPATSRHFQGVSQPLTMKKSVLFGLLVFAATVVSGFAQANQTQPATRSRIVDTKRVTVTNTMPPVHPISTPILVPFPKKTPNVVGQDPPVPPSDASNLNYKGLSFAQIKAKIAEAKRQMQTRPMTTAITEPASEGAGSMSNQVRIAFYS